MSRICEIFKISQDFRAGFASGIFTICKQDFHDLQEMSRIYKRRHDFQDEEENVGERKSLLLFIVFIVNILLGIKKFPFMQDEPLILFIVLIL